MNENSSTKKILKQLGSIGIYIVFVLVFIVFSVFNKNFLTGGNVMNIIVQSSIIAIVGIGQTLVILTGGIDLSIGSTVAFVGISAGLLMKAGVNVPLVLIISIVLGIAIGLLNGAIISFGKVPAFIVTLGTMGIVRGAALAINNGRPVASFSPEFEKISELKIFNVLPIFVVYCLISFGVIYVVLSKTRFGRHIYALGGNRGAAWLSGVKVKNIELWVYMLCGLFASIGAVMLAARMNYVSPTAAADYNIDSIAAVVIGGTAMTGGSGGVLGTLVGALFLGMLKNGLTILNISDYLQQIIIGIVIIAAVFFDQKKERI